MLYMPVVKAELSPAGYAIMDCMANHLCPISTLHRAADMPIKYTGMDNEKPYELPMSTVPREEALMAKKNHLIWTPNVTYTVNKLDRLDQDHHVLFHYHCQNSFLEM